MWMINTETKYERIYYFSHNVNWVNGGNEKGTEPSKEVKRSGP